MNKIDVAVIDYGIGNLLSVRRSLEHCGATVAVTSDPAEILAAPRVILPGVGAFVDGMKELRQRKLDVVVQEVAARGISLLGICLGMQMLLTESEEFGLTSGLGLISGKVIPIPATTVVGESQKIPHIGWSSLVVPSHGKNWSGTVLENIAPDEAVYFVHSFMASPSSDEDRIADCIYGGAAISAVIGNKNIIGCQFHPEKSGKVGLKVLQSFLAT
jgi:glutamine amidotransferase